MSPRAHVENTKCTHGCGPELIAFPSLFADAHTHAGGSSVLRFTPARTPRKSKNDKTNAGRVWVGEKIKMFDFNETSETNPDKDDKSNLEM